MIRAKLSEKPERGFIKLMKVIDVINVMSELIGYRSVTITSFLRKADYKSYHSEGLAVDIRTHDKDPEWISAVRVLSNVLKSFDKELYFNFHDELKGTGREHIHIAIKDGSLNPPKITGE